MPNITTYIDKEMYLKLQQEVEVNQTSESKIVQKALKKYWNMKK
jgi:hypothetical protein